MGPQIASLIEPSADVDCHACCTLKGCDKESQDESAVMQSAPVQLPIARIEATLVLPVVAASEPRAVHIQIESWYANAPPLDSPSRAPPASLN